MSKSKRNAERGIDADMPYLCWPVGRSGDVKEILGVAAALRLSRFHVIGWVVRWEELVFTHGNASGLVAEYNPRDLAAALDWKGDVSRLMRVLSDAGLVKRAGPSGKSLLHPSWMRSRTAAFLREKEETRRYWREWKAEKRRTLREMAKAGKEAAAAAAEGGGGAFSSENVSNGHPVDVRLPSKNVQRIPPLRKEGHPDPDAPPTPRADAGGVGFARWEIVQRLHPSPMNPEGCKRLLQAMSAEDWALCLWVLENREREGLSSISKKKRAFVMNAYEFIRKGAFHMFRPERARTEAARAAPKEKSPAEVELERREDARRALRELLDDPDAPEAKKQKRRDMHLRAHPGDAEWLASLAAPTTTTTTITTGVSN